MTDTIQVYCSKISRKTQRWRWVRLAGNGRKLSQSSEGYRDLSEVKEAAKRCNNLDGVRWLYPEEVRMPYNGTTPCED